MKDQKGLSNENIHLITGIVFAALLIFGPIQQYGLAVRTAYLVSIPLLVWAGLNYFGRQWKGGDKQANDRLGRAIAGMLAGYISSSVLPGKGRNNALPMHPYYNKAFQVSIFYIPLQMQVVMLFLYQVICHK